MFSVFSIYNFTRRGCFLLPCRHFSHTVPKQLFPPFISYLTVSIFPERPISPSHVCTVHSNRCFPPKFQPILSRETVVSTFHIYTILSNGSSLLPCWHYSYRTVSLLMSTPCPERAVSPLSCLYSPHERLFPLPVCTAPRKCSLLSHLHCLQKQFLSHFSVCAVPGKIYFPPSPSAVLLQKTTAFFLACIFPTVFHIYCHHHP